MRGKHMNNNIKDLKLVKGLLSTDEIPYSEIDGNGKLDIQIPKRVRKLPPEYNQITDEITGDIFIYKNQHITEIIGFNNLKTVGKLLIIDSNKSLTEISGFNSLEVVGWSFFIKSNKSLTKITGFSNLTRICCGLYIQNNPKLVTMSIPGNLVRAVNYGHDYGIVYNKDLEFKSPGDFINSPEIMDDLVTKFNPGDHGDQVIKQIVENIEEWGTDDTKTKVYSFLWEHSTPEHWKLVSDRIKHRYNPDYQGTTGRDVAKVNSGEVYGIF